MNNNNTKEFKRIGNQQTLTKQQWIKTFQWLVIEMVDMCLNRCIAQCNVHTMPVCRHIVWTYMFKLYVYIYIYIWIENIYEESLFYFILFKEWFYSVVRILKPPAPYNIIWFKKKRRINCWRLDCWLIN